MQLETPTLALDNASMQKHPATQSHGFFPPSTIGNENWKRRCLSVRVSVLLDKLNRLPRAQEVAKFGNQPKKHRQY